MSGISIRDQCLLRGMSNLTPCSKRLRRLTTDNEDRLSNLPPEIISVILSCLPTETAVRTSVLSRRWRHMWTSIYNIQIYSPYRMWNGRRRRRDLDLLDTTTCFHKFVDRVLLCTPRLRSFDLSCKEVSSLFDLQAWILGSLKHNAEIINIRIGTIHGHDPYQLCCFTGWTSSLRELRLAISCTVKFPTNNSFPNLKWLVLGCSKTQATIKIMTTRETSNGRRAAVLDFPVLECLELCNCEWLDVNLVEIQAPELVRFRSVRQCESVKDDHEDRHGFDIKICGPKLAMFESFGPINNYILVTPAVTSVCLLHNLPDRCALFPLRALKVLKALPNLKSLKLSGTTLQNFSDKGVVFPTLNAVKELEVVYNCPFQELAMVMKAFPSLESLVVCLGYYDKLEQEALATFIPSSSKLKRLVIFNFAPCHCDVAKSFMENANNLQEFTVWAHSNPEHITEPKLEEFRHLISNVKPKSSACAVRVVRLSGLHRRSCWFEPAPTLIMGQAGNTQLATTTSIIGSESSHQKWEILTWT